MSQKWLKMAKNVQQKHQNTTRTLHIRKTYLSL